MNCALFYSYKNFKDTLFIIFDHNKSATSYKRNKDVVAIYHDDEIIGYNIFHVNQYIKIILNGVVISLPKIIIGMINNMISLSGFKKSIEEYPNSYRIVKIVSNHMINIDGKNINISLPTDIEINKYAIYCNKNDVLLNLEISKEDHLLKENELNISNDNKTYYLNENEIDNKDFFVFKGESKND